MSLLRLWDTTGGYGLASAPLGDDPTATAAAVLIAALADAGRPYEQPTLVWCAQPPGQEEAVLAGIRQVVGDQVPIYGGSAADDDISGQWCLFDGHTLASDHLILVALFPSVPVACFFSSGYQLTVHKGRVTRAVGRTVYEIDGQSAAAVYRRWVNWRGSTAIGDNLLAQSTFAPLGRVIAHRNNTELTLLSHPYRFTPDGGLELFSTLEEGDQVFAMTGDVPSLQNRAELVVQWARNLLESPRRPLAGGLVIYCGGCRLAMHDHLDAVNDGIVRAMESRPFVVGYTYGEQGCFADGSSRHGNLMISTVLFGTR